MWGRWETVEEGRGIQRSHIRRLGRRDTPVVGCFGGGAGLRIKHASPPLLRTCMITYTRRRAGVRVATLCTRKERRWVQAGELSVCPPCLAYAYDPIPKLTALTPAVARWGGGLLLFFVVFFLPCRIKRGRTNWGPLDLSCCQCVCRRPVRDDHDTPVRGRRGEDEDEEGWMSHEPPTRPDRPPSHRGVSWRGVG